MAQFDYKKFLAEGGIEKYLIEENFGNDIESRYQFIRPLMSRLNDSARTEMLIDGMEEARAEDDKQAFDFYFVEAMKELGLEDELMEPNDDITPPGPEDMPGAKVPPFITDKEFQMRANAFALEEADSLINPEAEEIDAEDLDAAADYFDSLAENDDVLDEILDIEEGVFDRLKAKAKGVAAGAGTVAKNIGGAITGDSSKISSVKDAAQMAKFKSLSGDAIKQNDKALADIKKIFQDKKVSPKTMEKIQKYFDKSAELKKIQQALVGTVNEVEGEVQSEAMSDQLKINKLLQAANTIEDSLNDVNLELTDDQIDNFTEMILDLRSKAKAKLK